MKSTADDLNRLAKAIRRRNEADEAIARIIGRPAVRGHIGEFIASRVFGIKLYGSASHKGADGQFQKGRLRGKSVNIKFYGKQDGLLCIRQDALPKYFLVLTGPKGPAASSVGQTRPLVVEAVYLFDATKLKRDLDKRGVKIGVATSVRKAYWLAAELYPVGRCPLLTLSARKRELLGLFSGP